MCVVILEMKFSENVLKIICEKRFPVLLRNRLISAGLELVLSHTEKSCTSRIKSNFLRIVK